MWEYNRDCVLLFSGEYVDRQLCRDAILPMPVLCEVPCPKDCVLSPWTSWSLCSNTCSGKNSEGKQTRSRSILAYNAGDGRVFTIIKQLLYSFSTKMVWIELRPGFPLSWTMMHLTILLHSLFTNKHYLKSCLLILWVSKIFFNIWINLITHLYDMTGSCCINSEKLKWMNDNNIHSS